MAGVRPSDTESVTPIAPNTWIRRPRRNVGFAVAYALLAGVFVLLLLATAGEWGSGPVWPGLAAFLLGMTALTVRLMVGWARAGLMLADDEVVVRGPWATRRIARVWADRFEAGLQHTAVGNPTPGVVLRVGDGSAVNVAALATESMVWGSAGKVAGWEATAAALNELLTKGRN